MECPKCGAYNADTASFCNLCHEPFKKEARGERREASEKEKNQENEESVVEKEHQSPGFGIKVVKKPAGPDPQKVTKIAEPTDKKDSESQKAKITKSDKKMPAFNMVSITNWLYPALLSTGIAVITIFLVPKDQVNTNLALGKIILAVFMVGFVVSSDGIIKTKFQSALMGWLLGISAGSLAFLLIFFSLLLVRISPEFYTVYFLGSEVLIICVLTSIAVALFWSLEKVTPSQLIRLVLGAAAISLIVSWLVLKWTNPLPFAVFLSWPVSYYLLKWVNPAKST